MRTAAPVAFGGVVLIIVALTFESAILFVPGIAIVLICLLVPGWVAVAARGARLTRTLHADRVLEDQPLEATLEIGHGRLGLPGAEIIEPLAGTTLALRVSPLQMRRARTELRVVARFERRGRKTLGAPRLELSDPLSLTRTGRQGGGAGQEVLVLPRIEQPHPWQGAPGERDRFVGSTRSLEALAAVDIDGLQPYRHGTPASRIHWLALARGAGLLERRLQAEGGVGPLVVLDARCRQPGERLDRAVRAAASLTHYLARRWGCELLLPGERRALRVEPDLGGWPSAHARLAVVEGGPAAPAPALLQHAGSVLYVAAELAWDPRRQPGPFPGAVFVVPASLAGELHQEALFEVSGCVGLAPARARRLAATVPRRAA